MHVIYIVHKTAFQCGIICFLKIKNDGWVQRMKSHSHSKKEWHLLGELRKRKSRAFKPKEDQGKHIIHNQIHTSCYLYRTRRVPRPLLYKIHLKDKLVHEWLF